MVPRDWFWGRRRHSFFSVNNYKVTRFYIYLYLYWQGRVKKNHRGFNNQGWNSVWNFVFKFFLNWSPCRCETYFLKENVFTISHHMPWQWNWVCINSSLPSKWSDALSFVWIMYLLTSSLNFFISTERSSQCLVYCHLAVFSLSTTFKYDHW